MAKDPLVRTYDPKLITIIWGNIIITGFPEGTFLTIARNGDNFEKSKGADGTVDRINKNSNDYSATITIKQTSITNDALSQAMNEDLLTNTGVRPLTVKDLNGQTFFYARQAWIGKDPDDEYSDTLGSREWRLDTGEAEKFTGGNIG